MPANLSTQIHEQEIHDLIQTLRYEAGLSSRIAAHLRGLEKDLLGAYINAGDITSQRKLKALLDEARAAIADRYDAAQGVYVDEMPAFARLSAEKVIAGLNGLVKVDIFNMSLTVDQINAIASDTLIQGAPSADWWAAQEADTVFRFSNAVRGGMLRGATMDEMAREVRDLMQTSTRNAQALVRTSVISVNNAAHDAAYEANADLMDSTQWMATLDPKTCAACGALDGKRWDWREAHPVPSLHWGCRCMVLPVTKSWEQLASEAHGNSTLAKKLDQMDSGTRASMDGQIATGTTYEDWLASRSETMQREILGPSRYRLLESGKLKLSDLTDMRGNELTLKELAAL
jgi:SPP1 gp7 family putative phage head morphogenesis protein